MVAPARVFDGWATKVSCVAAPGLTTVSDMPDPHTDVAPTLLLSPLYDADICCSPALMPDTEIVTLPPDKP